MPELVRNTDLTLSAAPDLEQERARVAAYIDRELYAIERLSRSRLAALARARLDRLFDYVLGAVVMPGFSGVAPIPTDRVVVETRLCGLCATVLTRRPDGWVHAALSVTGHEPAPWGDVITYGTERDPAIVTEAELRLMDGNR